MAAGSRSDREQEEIGDCQFVQPVAYCGMLPETLERVAENEAGANMRVEERFDSHLVTGAKKTATRRVPNSEGKVSQQAIDAALSPNPIGAKNEFNVGSIFEIGLAVVTKLGNEIAPVVDPGIRDNPSVGVEAERLKLALGFPSRFQQRMTEANPAFEQHALCIGSPKRQRIGHSFKQTGIDRSAVGVQDSNDAAHSCFSTWGGLGGRISINSFS